MRTYIKKLQSKPEDVRKRILIGSLIVSMSFVFVVWISSLGYRFNKDNSVKTEEAIKPFALFGQTVSETYNNVSASVGNISLPKEENKKEEVKVEKIIDLIPVEY